MGRETYPNGVRMHSGMVQQVLRLRGLQPRVGSIPTAPPSLPVAHQVHHQPAASDRLSIGVTMSEPLPKQQPETGSELCDHALIELRGYLDSQADAVWSQYVGQVDKP